MSNTSFADPPTSSLPLVVHVGFSGVRSLLDTAEHPGIEPFAFEAAVATRLAEIIAQLPAQLGLSQHHFLCGVSQIAIGGDAIFTRICRDSSLKQRIFLPQATEEYLAAGGSDGPDFSEAQKGTAAELLSSSHIIQRRVVSDAPTREERFQDTNFEIARVSDVIIALVRDDGKLKPGGSLEMLEVAGKRGIPAIEVAVGISNGQATITTTWHRVQEFHAPKVPKVVEDAEWRSGGSGLPSIQEYCVALKNLGSRKAQWQRRFFTSIAAVIIATHVLATVSAISAINLHGNEIYWLLGFELLLLLGGFGAHHYLRHRRAVENWAMSRLVAEISRSVAAVGNFHTHLDFLFTLPFPAALRDVLRTLGVVHLQSTAALDVSWQSQRDAYVRNRLASESSHGQISYHDRTRDRARRYLNVAHRSFLVFSVVAIVATLTKLILHPLHSPAIECLQMLPTLLGGLAILAPVLAVAALSLASAFDLEARYHISAEVGEFLRAQRGYLEAASTRREYAHLLMETETRLLGETVNWYVRRSFLGIA